MSTAPPPPDPEATGYGIGRQAGERHAERLAAHPAAALHGAEREHVAGGSDLAGRFLSPNGAISPHDEASHCPVCAQNQRKGPKDPPAIPIASLVIEGELGENRSLDCRGG